MTCSYLKYRKIQIAMLSAMRDMEYPIKYNVVAISTPVSV